MQYDLFDKVLKFIELMTRSNGTTKQEVCHALGISVRSFYRYLEYFNNAGFHILSLRNRYSFDLNSPFFHKIMAFNFFSGEEIDAILELLENTSTQSDKAKALHTRLLHQKKWHVRNQYIIDKDYTDKLNLLNHAVNDKRIIVLHNYASAKSSSVTDRIVEPYLIIGHNDSVRCYEASTRTNKTFRISRIGSVELLPVNWIHEDRHTRLFTDAFNFSGDTMLPVEVILNFRAVRLLTEEYPGCSPYITRRSADEWRLKMNVCDFRGIGRFCLGIFRDVIPVGNEAFLDYLQKESTNIHGHWFPPKVRKQ